jgi:hypothetical protein
MRAVQYRSKATNQDPLKIMPTNRNFLPSNWTGEEQLARQNIDADNPNPQKISGTNLPVGRVKSSLPGTMWDRTTSSSINPLSMS